jgi:hypothetical protein
MLAYRLLDLHPVFSILAAAAILLLFLALALKTRFGFWALSAIFSLAWGAAASSLSETLFEGDSIWKVFFAVVGFSLSMALHWSMRKKLSYKKPPMPQQWQGGNAPNNQFTDFDGHHRG